MEICFFLGDSYPTSKHDFKNCDDDYICVLGGEAVATLIQHLMLKGQSCSPNKFSNAKFLIGPLDHFSLIFPVFKFTTLMKISHFVFYFTGVQLNEIPLVVELTISRRKRKRLPVYWMEVGSILLCMRITKETGCLLGMCHGSKHLITLPILCSFYFIQYDIIFHHSMCERANPILAFFWPKNCSSY